MERGAGPDRDWPRILLLTAVPISVALLVIQFLRPDQPVAPRPAPGDAPVTVAPTRPVPAWPTPTVAAALAPTDTASPGPTGATPLLVPHSTTSSTPATTAPQRDAPEAMPPRPFAPVSVEAEAAGNRFAGAEVATCATCDGGARVNNIHGNHYLEMYAVLPEAGNRTVAVRYESDGDRDMAVRINDGPTTVHRVPGSGGWETPATYTFETYLPAGALTLRFTGQSPDIDRVIVS